MSLGEFPRKGMDGKFFELSPSKIFQNISRRYKNNSKYKNRLVIANRQKIIWDFKIILNSLSYLLIYTTEANPFKHKKLLEKRIQNKCEN